MGTKKIPMRMCTGCHEMKPKRELLRIVKTPEGEIKFDITGKLNGRGAYICKSAECLSKAQKSGGLSKAFSAQISNEVFNRIETELKTIE